MANVNPSGGTATSWLGPDREENDLRRHLPTLRHRGWLIVATVVLALVVAIAYVKTSTPVYQASSSLLVTSVPSGGSVPTNLPGLLYQTADPTRDIQTAATVVDSMTTARAVKRALKLPESPVTILGKISVQPISDSNVLAVTAKADTAAGAARPHNVSSLPAQSAPSPKTSPSAGTSGTSPSQELTELQTLRTAPLPDLSVSALATPPTGRVSPRATLSVGAALVVGLVLGILGVLALEAFDLTLRREDQLRSL